MLLTMRHVPNLFSERQDSCLINIADNFSRECSSFDEFYI